MGLPRTPRRSERLRTQNVNNGVFNTDNTSRILNHTFSLPDLTVHQNQNDEGIENCHRVTTSNSVNIQLNNTFASQHVPPVPPSNQSLTSSKRDKSVTLKRRQIEIQIEFAKRKLEQQNELLHLEKSLALAQIEEEYEICCSNSTRSQTSSFNNKMKNVASWVDNIPNENYELVQPSVNNIPSHSQHINLPNHRSSHTSIHNQPLSTEDKNVNQMNIDLLDVPQSSFVQVPASHQLKMFVRNEPQQNTVRFQNQQLHQDSYHDVQTDQLRQQHQQLQRQHQQQHQHQQLQRQHQQQQQQHNHEHQQQSQQHQRQQQHQQQHQLQQQNHHQQLHNQQQQDHPRIQNIETWITRQSINKDLPKFSGNPLEWPQFINQFESTSKMCNLSNIENQMRLQKCLSGQALNVVQPLLIYPQNVNRVIEILRNRFGRTEHIIHLLLDQVRNFCVIKDESKLNSLIEFFDVLSNFVYTLESLNEHDHIRNPFLYDEILTKLPINLRFEFAQYLDSQFFENPPILVLHSWLERKVSAANKLVKPSFSNILQSESKGSKSKALNFSIFDKQNKFEQICLYCDVKNHGIQICEKFKSLNVNDRWNFITKKHACISCLKTKHSLRTCNKRKKCNEENCDKFHHQLLHSTPKFSHPVSSDVKNEITSEPNLHVHDQQKCCSLLKIIPIQLKGPKMILNSYAMLDEGSTVTLIDSNIANQLGLDGPSKHLRLQWTNNQFNDQKDSKIVSVAIKGVKEQDKFFTLRHAKTVSDLNLPTQTLDMNDICHKYSYLNHLKHLTYFNAKPTVIIGQDNWPVIVTRKLTHGIWNGPTASKTLLGWVVHGNISNNFITNSNYSSNSIFHCHEVDSCYNSDKDDLNLIQELLKQQWSFDIRGTLSEYENNPSIEDKHCLEMLNQSIRRVNDKFESGLLWANENVILPESKSTALRRLQCLEKKMDRDKNYGNLYITKMNDYIKKGYLKKLTKEEVLQSHDRMWYLPHFGVTNPNKPGKLRIVFDAAAKTNGHSLNDFLLVGPDMYNVLPDILMNFRIYKYAFIGDIKEMFLQIGICKNDRFAQRLLWREFERSNPPDVYEFQVLFFGAKCSPCIAQQVKTRNAEQFKNEFPRACDDIINKHYMDDYLGGANTEQDAIKLVKDVIHVHKKGGFEICNFVSNSHAVLDSIDESLHSKNILESFNFTDDNAEERVLGMWWNYLKDEFLFKLLFHKIDIKILNYERRPTKRDILKIVMSVFDPLGFISCLILPGKILMQQIWESGIGWDDEITDFHYDMWLSWSTNLKNCTNVRVPRMMVDHPLNECKIELHMFCDASEHAYASVAYLRFIFDSKVHCCLINSKARVAPLKPTSIPRLELQAALLGARLSSNIKKILNVNISSIILWSDSNVVLAWIKTSSKRFKTFVAQRIGEIHDLTQPEWWRYIPSKLNIADDATKSKSINLNSESIWFKGPEFLYIKNESEWPSNIINNACPEDISNEMKPQYCMIINEIKKPEFSLPDIKRFSNWCRFIRTVAWVNKIFQLWKFKIGNNSNLEKELSPNDISKAEIYVFHKIQNDCYENEIKCLRNGKEIPKSSPLNSFSCFIDENDILRIKGRLNNSTELGFSSKFPIILDNSHKIVKLLVQYYHILNNHIGIETVISNIRERFWITNMRRAVKNAIYNCQFCRIRKSQTIIPKMGQLPLCRVEKTVRPFLKVGIDYFGPINVTINRHKEKRYGVIFICMVIKAIHIEIAQDLSFNSFMHVFIQFGCRRGFPEEIYSDNGSNFKKASKEIQNALDNWPKDELIKFLTMRKCKWYFNAPLAPHTGGLWERNIQLIKKHLNIILHERSPREFVLKTLFAEIEGIINSRPLTFNSTNPDDLEPITPNHLLIGPKTSIYPLLETSDKDLIILSLWKSSQRLADIFWKRWVSEYLPSVLHSKKWSKDTKRISVGDLVFIVDSECPRNTWPRGKVEKLYPAKDGQIRLVDVKTNVGVYRRHVKYIVKIDLLNESNS